MYRITPHDPAEAAPHRRIRHNCHESLAAAYSAVHHEPTPPKSPGSPKRAWTPYMFYSRDNRERVKRANPDASFTTIGRILGTEWSNLSAKAQEPYVRQAEDDRLRYEADKARYDAKQ
ncbi:hypothetical protein [Embleya sp. NPDC005971]|uniref:hypothetical protein n=1 Tax=Embleya sp. NPDC005971 TaxID=3156724 RepID=UPI003403EAED